MVGLFIWQGFLCSPGYKIWRLTKLWASKYLYSSWKVFFHENSLKQFLNWLWWNLYGWQLAGNHIVQSLAVNSNSINFDQFSVCVTLKPWWNNTYNYEKQNERTSVNAKHLWNTYVNVLKFNYKICGSWQCSISFSPKHPFEFLPTGRSDSNWWGLNANVDLQATAEP